MQVFLKYLVKHNIYSGKLSDYHLAIIYQKNSHLDNSHNDLRLAADFRHKRNNWMWQVHCLIRHV